MSRRLSRFVGGVELVMLLVPVSMSAIGGLVILGRWSAIVEEPGPFIAILLYLALPVGVALAAIVALWRTLGAFVLVGPHALLGLTRAWWWILIAGCLLAVAGLLFFGAERLGLISGDSFGLYIPMGIGVGGAILLIPLIHVAIEYRLARRSATHMERTRNQ